MAVSTLGRVYLSMDGGASWGSDVLRTARPRALRGVAVGTAAATAVAVAVGANNSIWAANATSGFAAWTFVATAATKNVNFNGVGTYNGGQFIAVGDGGAIAIAAPSSTGSSWVWTRRTYQVGATAPALSCVSHGNAAVAYVGGTGGTLIKTSDGGLTWISLLVVSATGSGSLAAVLGLGAGGATWGPAGTDGFRFHSVSALSPSVGASPLPPPCFILLNGHAAASA